MTEEYQKALAEQDPSLEILAEALSYGADKASKIEERLRSQGKVNFETIFEEPIGYYFLKLFLKHDFEEPKAIFLKDWANFKNVRFESARKRVARLMYERFVAEQSDAESSILIPEDQRGLSTFEIIRIRDREKNMKKPDDDDEDGKKDYTPEVSLSKAPTGGGFSRANTNAIGVYGRSIVVVKDKIEKGVVPNDLFDEVAVEVQNDLQHDVFPRFLKSGYFKRYITAKVFETREITIKDIETFRILGRGGFGEVYACKKINSGALYALKEINKKLVQAKQALPHIMAELETLKMIDSPFVSHLKYAFQDEDTLYIVIELLLGGDLKYHLVEAGRFSLERARFYAAEVLIALEHMHKVGIVYRDLKLENVILDDSGHAKIVDLGLAVILKDGARKTSGYAGTPGYCAPEMVANHSYNGSVDVFSFGVLLYRMMRGSKPFTGRTPEELDRSVLKEDASWKSSVFENRPALVKLLKGLLRKNPKHRLGCGARGLQEIKEHEFFKNIDWGLLEAGYVDPPFVPDDTVNAPSSEEIGQFNLDQMQHITLSQKFKNTVSEFHHISSRAVQEELVTATEKAERVTVTSRTATNQSSVSTSSNSEVKSPKKKDKKDCIIS